jgi:hypothetical protein
MNLLTYLRCQWDRAGAVLAVLLGAAALVLGWFGVSGKVLPAEQIPYVVSGGLGGIFLLGVGSVLWLSADIRDEWRKLDELDRGEEGAPAAEAQRDRAPLDVAVTDGSSRVTAVR